MEKTAELIKQITERLNRRPARIDKADRLWDAAVFSAVDRHQAGSGSSF